MKGILKKISYFILFPFFKKYSNKKRKLTINGIQLNVNAGVFNPRLHYSTKFLLSWLVKQNIVGKNILELGCGAGLLSIQAAKQKAIVISTDISQQACLCIKENMLLNKVDINVYQSDLFTDIPWQIFDVVLINPPYYPKQPKKESEYAWYCGEQFEYFEKLFFQMGKYMNNKSKAIMVLSEDCNIDKIQTIVLKNKFNWNLIIKKKILFEENYLFEITL